MIPTWGTTTGANAVLNSADLLIPLTHSLVADKSPGDATATFTRATTATVRNNDGYLVTAVSGEVRFEGARRVRNIIGNSQDFAAAYWLKSGAAISASDTITAPDGTLTADTLTASAGNVTHFLYKSGLTVSAGRHVQSWHVKYIGHRWVVIQNYDGTTSWEGSFDLLNGVVGAVDAGALSTIESLGDSWYRITLSSVYVASTGAYSVLALNNSDSATIQTWNAAGTESVGVWGHQLEDVTAQTTQTAGEYVSVGALDYRSTQDPLYLSLPGTAGHYASTPDTAFGTGNVDFRVKIAATSYAPVANNGLIVKDSGGAGGRSFIWRIAATTGVMTFFMSNDGNSLGAAVSSAAISTTAGQDVYLRFTRVAADGKSNFYTSTDGTTWTQSGSADQVMYAGVGLYDVGTELRIGQESGSAAPFSGKIYQAQIYNTIGGTTPVVDFNPQRDATTPTGTITSTTTSEVWTINGASSVVRNAAYHGSMVDGVKAYDTDRSGNPISTSGSYPLVGYVPWEARTNLCLQSNAFTTTWLNTADSILQNSIGPDGTTSAWTLTDTSAVAARYLLQDIALTAAQYTASVFVKKTTGAQASYPVMFVYYGGGLLGAPITIDTSNGVATVWTAYTGFTMLSGRSATVTSHNADYWRVTSTFTATAATYRMSMFPAGTTNPIQSTGVEDITAQGSAVFYGAQVELGSFATPYIPTTTIAVARNADVLTYTGAGISALAGAPHTVFAEIIPRDITSASSILIVDNGTTDNRTFLLDSTAVADKGRLFVASGGATQADLEAGTMVNSVPYRMAGAVATNSARFAGAGSVSAEDTSVTLPAGLTTLRIGLNTAGTSSANCPVRNVRVWDRALSSSELQAITA